MGWILRLEDQRILRDAILTPVSLGGETRSAAPAQLLGPQPDLIELLVDDDTRLRRRAALAVGRVGRPEGVAP